MKIREAKAALEAEARSRAEHDAEEARAKLAERERQTDATGKRPGGRPPAVPDPNAAVPASTAQRNFTDPESRIMRDAATKSFVQGYNVQAAVDRHAQVIVATGVTQAATDVQQLVPMLERVYANTGCWPTVDSADAGYFSAANVTGPVLQPVELYVPSDKSSHRPSSTAPSAAPDARPPAPAPSTGPAPPAPPSAREQMRSKVRTDEGRAHYAKRKGIVEPVFGQTKACRGFRRFSVRGLVNVSAEWDLICLTHNVLKLFRAGAGLAPA